MAKSRFLVDGIAQEQQNTYVVILGLAIGLITWHGGILDWWQALLFAAVAIATSLYLLYTRAKYTVLILLLTAGTILLVCTHLSIFWIVSGPDKTVPVTVSSKWTEVRGGTYGGYHDYYFVEVVDGAGHGYRLTLTRSLWESLSKGDRKSITYHREAVGGQWLSRRVVTQLGEDSILHGGGRFGSPMEGLNTVMDMLASTTPLGYLVWLYMRMKKKQVVIERISMQMRERVLEEPGISHTRLVQSVWENRELKESAINQLIEQGQMRCERSGRARKYFPSNG